MVRAVNAVNIIIIMNLMIERGRSCWTARNEMIYGERCQHYTQERKRLQSEAREYLYTPKKEALGPIENIRATRKDVRNLPNVEIANWIADQRQRRQMIQQRRSTNIIIHTKKEAELQLLDGQFKI